jgi:hypothetical protein
VLANATQVDMAYTRLALGSVSGSQTINYATAMFQTLTTTGSVSLAFSNFPPAGSAGVLTLQVTVSSVAHTLTLPAVVSVNAQGIQGLNTATNIITFAATGTYGFEFVTSDGGSTVTVNEVNNRLQPFNNSSEDLAASASANLALTTSFFSTAAAETATLAAGVEGQIKVLAMRGDSGDMVITVTNAVWGSTITFTAIGQACTLLYINAKWFCIGNNGATFA